MEPLVESISDTAKWVAFFRAEESERPDAVFYDPFARKLAGEKGEQIANAATFSRNNSWSFVTRTFLFDHYVAQYVREGYDTVVNLAAGLDTRPYRMELPDTLKWIDIDLPAMISYKNKMLQDEKPKCQLRSVSIDLADRHARLALFEQLGGRPPAGSRPANARLPWFLRPSLTRSVALAQPASSRSTTGGASSGLR